jgi:sporulation-regulated protein 3
MPDRQQYRMTIVDSTTFFTPQSSLNSQEKIDGEALIKNIDQGSETFSHWYDSPIDDKFKPIKELSNDSKVNGSIDNICIFKQLENDVNNRLIDLKNDTLNESDNKKCASLDGSVSEESCWNRDYHNNEPVINYMDINDVGSTCIPIQTKLRVYKTSCNFTILCVGESGVGKTSFINTLFDSLITEKTRSIKTDFRQHPNKTRQITSYKVNLVKDGLEIKLKIIDTPGLGEHTNNKNCWYPIAKYIDEQYRNLVYQENQPDRSKLTHNEIHACLYFIVPSAVSLNQLDIDAMKNLSKRVNLIPIISKADGFTIDELNAFKERIRNTLKEENIEICELFEEKNKITQTINVMPFTTINSIETHMNKDNKYVRGRKYKWGLSEVENVLHCDFLKIRNFLLESCMCDLISSTENYYENYRRSFMRYRLGKAINLTIPGHVIQKLDSKEYSKKIIKSNSKGSHKSDTKSDNSFAANLDELINIKDSIEILQLMNRMSINDIETDLIAINPNYSGMERQIKNKITGAVRTQNQKFRIWKKTLYEKQDKFNKDIEQVHQRMVNLQNEIKRLKGFN